MAPSGPATGKFAVPVVGYWLAAPAVVMRASALAQAIHSAPSGPTAMPTGLAEGSGYSVNWPFVVIRPAIPLLPSVNQSAPSGPVTMPTGPLFAVGTGYSATEPPLVAIRPILLPLNSANHSAPSGPAAITGPGCSPSVWDIR